MGDTEDSVSSKWEVVPGKHCANLSMHMSLFDEVRGTVDKISRDHAALSERVSAIGQRLDTLGGGVEDIKKNIGGIREVLHEEALANSKSMSTMKEAYTSAIATCRDREDKRWAEFLENSREMWLDHNVKQAESITSLKSWSAWIGGILLAVWTVVSGLFGWYFTNSMSAKFRDTSLAIIRTANPPTNYLQPGDNKP